MIYKGRKSCSANRSANVSHQ